MGIILYTARGLPFGIDYLKVAGTQNRISFPGYSYIIGPFSAWIGFIGQPSLHFSTFDRVAQMREKHLSIFWIIGWVKVSAQIHMDAITLLKILVKIKAYTEPLRIQGHWWTELMVSMGSISEEGWEEAMTWVKIIFPGSLPQTETAGGAGWHRVRQYLLSRATWSQYSFKWIRG